MGKLQSRSACGIEEIGVATVTLERVIHSIELNKEEVGDHE